MYPSTPKSPFYIICYWLEASPKGSSLVRFPMLSIYIYITYCSYANSHNNNMHYNVQVYATIKSGSLAIAASTLDSLLDLMAGGILWFTHLAMKNINIYKYPIGKLRVQPVGIIIFAAVMATLGMLQYLHLP